MDCAVDPNNPNTYYGFTQFGGSLNVSYNGGVSGQGVASAPEAGNWITPMSINNDGELYAGYRSLYLLVNQQWQAVSGDVFGGRLHRVEIDPNNVDIIFVARYNDLYRSTNKGVSFTKVYTATNNISSVEINNNNNSIIYLTTSSGEDGEILKSNNGGNSFIDITNNLPSESKLIIKHQPHSPLNDLYIGTTLGVYHINDTMTNWETYSTNLPNVPIRDLEININDHKILAGTYGRSVWESPIEVIAPNDDIRLMTISNPSENIQCSNTITPIITVKNNGQNVINQVNINYTIDGTILNYTYNGIINSQNIIDISLPQTNNLTLGEHTMQVSTIITNDAYSENNSSNTTFYINQLDSNPTIVNPFSNATNEWLVIGNQNVWEIGQPTTTLLGNIGSTGYTTLSNSNYPDNISSYLVSPCYDLTSITNPIMKFNMAFDIEIDWDVLYVEYTTNQGATWQVLGTADDTNWYNSNYDAHQLTIGKQWTGTDSILKEYSNNLNFLTNENNISFRFTFLTDQNINNEGVLIDDFVIEGEVTNAEEKLFSDNITISPNPSKGIFNVQNNNNEKLDIHIFEVTGKVVYVNTKTQSNNFTIDLSSLEKGVYFMNIKSNNHSFTKKIMLN